MVRRIPGRLCLKCYLVLPRANKFVSKMLAKRGAEGQSRTDTGLPPPVFELYWRCASQSLRIWDGVI